MWAWDNVYRLHDAELHVTCWVLADYHAGGISCLPDSALTRDGGP